MTLSIKTSSVTFSIEDLYLTLNINHKQEHNVQTIWTVPHFLLLRWVSYAERRYSEWRYAGCRGDRKMAFKKLIF
jgi:hypothetical protein